MMEHSLWCTLPFVGVTFTLAIMCNLQMPSEGSVLPFALVRHSKRFQLKSNSISPVLSTSQSTTSDDDEGDWVKITSASTQVTANVGDTVELWCEAMGNPPPNIYWLRNHNLVQQYDDEGDTFEPLMTNHIQNDEGINNAALGKTYSILRLPCISRSEFSVTYMCVASSRRKTVRSHMYIEKLPGSDKNVAPRCLQDTIAQPAELTPRITLYNPLMLQNIGQDVMLECNVESSPKSIIRWSNSIGQPLRGPRFEILKSGALIISRIKWSDMGQYTCTAESKLGQDSVQTFLYPMLVS